MPQTLVCPKCGGIMTSIERGGVRVEQCGDCGGLFFERGELERLIEAEDAHYVAAPPTAPVTGYPPATPAPGYPPRRRRRGGFLEELFDF